jgi:hypothetical protein
MRLLIAVLVASVAACLGAGCGKDQSFGGDPRGGAAAQLDCVDRLSLERDSGSALTRQSLVRRLASVRELRTGDYTVFASGPGGLATFFDPTVPIPVSLRAGFVSWRQGYHNVNVVSHTATTRYMQAVLRCADFTPRARTPNGTIWQPGRERSRIIIERRGILITGQNLPLLRKVAAAANSVKAPRAPAGWETLRQASGQAAGLAHKRSSCATFQVLSTLSRHQVKLGVRLAPGQRLRDVRAPRGVRLGRARHSAGTATLRAHVAEAARAVIVFAGVPPEPVQPWKISCR